MFVLHWQIYKETPTKCTSKTNRFKKNVYFHFNDDNYENICANWYIALT